MASTVPTFQRGLKKIYLPNIIFKLLRPPPDLPLNQAIFQVPMNINKLDIRDYLTHIYGLQVVNVRTLIQSKSRTLYKGGQQTLKQTSYKKAFVTMTHDFTFPPIAEKDKDSNDDPYGRHISTLQRDEMTTKLKGWRVPKPTNTKAMWRERSKRDEKLKQEKNEDDK